MSTNRKFILTEQDQRRIKAVVRDYELRNPAATNNGGMYVLDRLPYPKGNTWSYGVTFPSSFWDGTSMSTVLVCAPGPAEIPGVGLSLFPSCSCVLAHASTYNQIFSYYNSSSNYGISAIPRTDEIVNSTIFPSTKLDWLYTIKMGKDWIETATPRPIGGKSTTTVPDDKATWRCVQTADNKVMVYAGTIRHHGLGHWATVDTEVTLSGSEYLWIFVCFAREGTYAPYIETQVDEPISDTSTIRIPLSLWKQTAVGVYALEKTTHKYDLHMGNPLI